jgi:hypothetical protein
MGVSVDATVAAIGKGNRELELLGRKGNNKLEFETKNAGYTLSLEMHDFPTAPSKSIENYDAIVIETGACTYLNPTAFILGDTPYKGLVDANLECVRPKPVFYVDIPPSTTLQKTYEEGALFSVLADYAVANTLAWVSIAYPPYTLPLALPFAGMVLPMLGMTKTGRCETVNKFNSFVQLSLFGFSSGYRSAACADKIERSIAPALREDIGRKPNFFITYGAGHADIAQYLRHKTLRETVVRLHARNPLRDNSYIDFIGEVNFDGNKPLNLGEVVFRCENQLSQKHTLSQLVYGMKR